MSEKNDRTVSWSPRGRVAKATGVVGLFVVRNQLHSPTSSPPRPPLPILAVLNLRSKSNLPFPINQFLVSIPTMSGVLRRIIAHRGSSSSILRNSSLSSRAGSKRVFSATEEICIHPNGFGSSRNFFHGLSSGYLAISRPIRGAVRLKSMALQSGFIRQFSTDSGELVDAVVPFMGESVTDGTLANFLKNPGDRVEVDEPIAQVETDKVTIDITSPEAGIIQKFVAKEGDTVEPGVKIAVILKGSEAVAQAAAPEEVPEKTAAEKPSGEKKAKPKAEAASVLQKPKSSPASPSTPPKQSPTEPQLPPKDRERRIPMPRLRKRVATRLKDSQNTFALLTTFNEVDMTNLMKLRTDYKDAFVEKHGVKLGFMSGFVKAAVSALQQQPVVNAVIDGDDIIYRDYIDISVAVGTPKGLVVPVIRNADRMNFAEIEKEINALAKKANDGSLSIDEMAGGTFTISNGGVYGSLLSTPIINPPQSAILGMHSIMNRPMVVQGNIVARPMMYIALTYDHRLIDGREAVYFLRRIKDVVEDPRRLLLDV